MYAGRVFALLRRLEMGRTLDPLAGKNWKLVPRLSTCEVLVTKVLEEKPGGGQSFAWLFLDPARQRRTKLPMKAKLPGGFPAPGFCSKTNELLFLADEGITAYNLTTRREHLLIPIDRNLNHVWDMQFSTDAERIIFLLGERAESRVDMKATATEPGRALLVHMKSYSLHTWTAESGGSRLLKRFAAWPVSLDVDWCHDMAFALLGARHSRDLVKIHLTNGEVEVVRNADAASCLAISPRHTLLTWGRYNSPGIVETLPDGQDIALTDFGGYPAVSPDGRRFAFTVGDYEVWMKDAGGAEPERIVSFPAAESGHTVDRIAWCGCGNHFAVCLTGLKAKNPTQPDKRPLMVIDCNSREILMCDDLISIGTTGERVWAPSDVVKDYFGQPVA